jgi:hypothetical protein
VIVPLFGVGPRRRRGENDWCAIAIFESNILEFHVAAHANGFFTQPSLRGLAIAALCFSMRRT